MGWRAATRIRYAALGQGHTCSNTSFERPPVMGRCGAARCLAGTSGTRSPGLRLAVQSEGQGKKRGAGPSMTCAVFGCWNVPQGAPIRNRKAHRRAPATQPRTGRLGPGGAARLPPPPPPRSPGPGHAKQKTQLQGSVKPHFGPRRAPTRPVSTPRRLPTNSVGFKPGPRQPRERSPRSAGPTRRLRRLRRPCMTLEAPPEPRGL